MCPVFQQADRDFFFVSTMNISEPDISSRLISSESLRQKLPTIFLDSMVVDLQFNINVISQNVLDFLEFTNEELAGKSINYLSGEEDIVQLLQKALSAGYFEERQIGFYTKSNRLITIGISGFYLGLISDINGRIILKIRNLDEVQLINQQLQQKKAELDKFIYRAAHDLRGPLATMQGLLNLLRIREDNSELDRILQLLDAHAQKLDERLYHMVYLAQSDDEDNAPENSINFNVFETLLRKVIEQNAFVDFLAFHYSAPRENLKGVNEVLLKSLLTNLLLYLLSLPKSKLNNQIFFRLLVEQGELSITIGAHGFSVEDAMRKAMRQEEFIYTDMIHYPRLLNFFAAQKIAWKLNARMNVHFLSTEKQRISISIPVMDVQQMGLL